MSLSFYTVRRVVSGCENWGDLQSTFEAKERTKLSNFVGLSGKLHRNGGTVGALLECVATLYFIRRGLATKIRVLLP